MGSAHYTFAKYGTRTKWPDCKPYPFYTTRVAKGGGFIVRIKLFLSSSNLPTAVQTLLGGSPHRGLIAAPTVPYDLPLVRLMYEYSWYEVPYWYEYLLPATYPALPGPALPCPDPLALTCYNLS